MKNPTTSIKQQERQDGRVIYCAYIVRDGRRAKAFRIVVG